MTGPLGSERRRGHLLHAATDMRQAARGVDLLEQLADPDERRIVQAGIIATYARPFANREGGGLEPDDDLDPWLAKLHSTLLAMVESRTDPGPVFWENVRGLCNEQSDA